jgi:glycosyltransferase involved in cell wall biosynthesis
MIILFVGHSSGLAGAERSMQHLVTSATRARHHVVVVLPSPGPLSQVLPVEVIHSPTPWWMGARQYFPLGLWRLAQIPLATWRMKRLIGEAAPDLVISNSAVTPVGALAARLCGVPHLWIVRESITTNSTLRSILPKRVIGNLILRLSNEVLCVSGYVETQMRSLVHHQIRTGQMRKMTRRDDVGRSVDDAVLLDVADGDLLWSWSAKGDMKILSLGTISREKGQEDLVRAIAQCRADGIPATAAIVGQGKPAYEKRLKRLIEVAGVAEHVRVMPWDLRPQRYFLSADIFSMTSRNEALGRVTIESLIHGVPVVGYACGATPELVPSGAGILVEDTPAALAQAFCKLWRDRKLLRMLGEGALREGRRRAEMDPWLDVADSLSRLAHN